MSRLRSPPIMAPDSDGAIRPFMFEPQHGTSSEEEAEEEDSSNQQETVESDSDGAVRSRLGDWCACTNCQVMPTETESISC